MLGEIHIALLRSILKDIEDVARTTRLGANLNSAVSPCGGHLQVVEGVCFLISVVCKYVLFPSGIKKSNL